MVLDAAGSDRYWTDLERHQGDPPNGDVKLIWEMGRFGWAFTLGRAYRVSDDERYPLAFWELLESFIDANPPYFGSHWTSAQEVALRLMALSFSAQVFNRSIHSTAERKVRLGRAIAFHAARIPPSMSYARAQGNNHLLVEAVGLYTAGVILHSHPDAVCWLRIGWRWSNKALLDQIAADGSYVQQSTNYHRLMLQAALCLHTLAISNGDVFSEITHQRLAQAVRWLYKLLDSQSGRVPNLGPNDGAYILPLSECPFHDYRPVLQAASQAFIGDPFFEPGLWDELALWLPGQAAKNKSKSGQQRSVSMRDRKDSCQPLVLYSQNSWAYLRAANFKHRPGHADQLHMDLWCRGLNVASDAGTYLYNAEQPWDNALSSTFVHNTVSVDGQDQMTRAGRFLWLDWAQARDIMLEKPADGSWLRAAAWHDGYRRLGVSHRRAVTAFQDDRWLVEDTLTSTGLPAGEQSRLFIARLHWLLPDWPWSLSETSAKARLELLSPNGPLSISMSWQAASPPSVQLVRAGELLAGTGPVSPVSGWYSPAYGSKQPALSLSVALESHLPLAFETEWNFN
jgi:hypothetical protein